MLGKIRYGDLEPTSVQPVRGEATGHWKQQIRSKADADPTLAAV